MQRTRTAPAHKKRAWPMISGRLRAYNVVAAFPNVVDARRACAALRGARLRGASISAGCVHQPGGVVRLGGYASETTVSGGVFGALAGLFAGGLIARFGGGTTDPAGIMAGLMFGISSGAVLGGMAAGSARKSPDRVGRLLEAIEEGPSKREVYVAVHTSNRADANLAAGVLAGLAPLDMRFVGPRGEPYW